MSRPRDEFEAPRPAGPGPGDGGPLRAEGPSSTPPSPGPPTGGGTTEDDPGAAPTAEASPTPPAGASDSGREAEQSRVEKDFDALLADTQRERDEYLDLAKRTKADFENYRKRMAADVQAATARGKAELARDLIDAVDNLERALEAAGVDPGAGDGGSAVEDAEGLTQGVLMVFRGLRETLQRNGIEAVDPKGEKFDPTLHEALSKLPAEGVETGTVVEVMQKGYRLGEQLIRPARVVVAE